MRQRGDLRLLSLDLVDMISVLELVGLDGGLDVRTPLVFIDDDDE